MLGKFYTTSPNVVNANNLIPLGSSRVCGCGLKLIDGNAIEICKAGCYEVEVSVSASSADLTAHVDLSIVIGDCNTGNFVQSAGARAITTTTTAGATNNLGITDTIRVCNNDCCNKTLIAVRTENQITVSNIIITVRRVC